LNAREVCLLERTSFDLVGFGRNVLRERTLARDAEDERAEE
jgi:2,4-dienoyl-CoA reductase-like NADH-dependent reductase (Old Yellow Enzyme family)